TDEPEETFEPGVNQWGFLGGKPVKLDPAADEAGIDTGDAADTDERSGGQSAAAEAPAPTKPTKPKYITPPPPTRSRPFGRKRVAAPADETPDFGEFDDAPVAHDFGGLMGDQARGDIDVFSQLGAPPD